MPTQITSEGIAGSNITIGPDGTTAAIFNSATFDAVLGPAVGSIAIRGPNVWSALAPGVASYVLQTNGANAAPSWVPNNNAVNSGALDSAFGSAVGSMLWRSGGGWATLAVGASINSILTNSGGNPSWQDVSTFMDSAFSAVQGAILYRDAGIWKALGPGTAGQLLKSGGAAANPSWTAGAGTGTVTSIGLTLPAMFSVTGSPVTTTGTIAATLANQNANLVFAGPASGGAAAPTFRALTSADYGVLQASKNYVLNGAMMVNQRNPSGTFGVGTATSVVADFPVDMFSLNSSFDGTVSGQQIAQVTPGGSPNRLKLLIGTPDASIAAGQYVAVIHKIEGQRAADLRWGTAAAKAVTLDFGVNLPTGTYGVSIQNAAQNRSYVQTITISAGEAGTDVRRTLTFPGDTAGTWPKDNTASMLVFFTLAGGSSFQTAAGAWGAGAFFTTSAQSNFAGTAANVAHLFDVGLYAGSAAPAVFQVPEFDAELRLCQRYWEKSYDYTTFKGTATFNGVSLFVLNGVSGSTQVAFSVPMSTRKRTLPTVTLYSPNTGSSGVVYDAVSNVDRASSADNIGDRAFRSIVTTASQAGQAMYCHWIADAGM